jgi:hypothetical protein
MTNKVLRRLPKETLQQEIGFDIQHSGYADRYPLLLNLDQLPFTDIILSLY